MSFIVKLVLLFVNCMSWSNIFDFFEIQFINLLNGYFYVVVWFIDVEGVLVKNMNIVFGIYIVNI